MGLKGLLSAGKPKKTNERTRVDDPFAGLEITPDDSGAAAADRRHFDPATWPVERLDIAEALWGRGNIQPGSHDDVAALMNVCALTSAKTMLDMNAGLGGGSRAMVQKFGVWLVGLDRDEALVADANKRSLELDMDKKAIFYACDYESVSLKPSAYDAILCRNLISTVQNKDNLFDQIRESLKPSAHLVIADFVLGNPAGNEALLKTIWDKEVPRLQLQRPQQIAAALKSRNFLVHVAVDVSAEYKLAVLAGWAKYVETLKGAKVSPFVAEIILSECERWLTRVAALDAGALRVYRFHATNSAEKKPGRVGTLSDWKY